MLNYFEMMYAVTKALNENIAGTIPLFLEG
jgi:hypothetical protein